MRYWLYSQGQIQGPHSERDLTRLSGFGADSLVCPEGVAGNQPADWRRAASIPALSSVLASQAAPSQAVPAAEIGAGGPPLGMISGGEFPGLPAGGPELMWQEVPPPVSSGEAPEILAQLEELWKDPQAGPERSGRMGGLEDRIYDLEGRLERFAQEQRNLLGKLEEKDALAAELLSKLEPLERRARLAEAEKERALEELRSELARLQENLARKEAEIRSIKARPAGPSALGPALGPVESIVPEHLLPPAPELRLNLPDIDLTSYLSALEKSLGTGALPPLPTLRPPELVERQPAPAAPAGEKPLVFASLPSAAPEPAAAFVLPEPVSAELQQPVAADLSSAAPAEPAVEGMSAQAGSVSAAAQAAEAQDAVSVTGFLEAAPEAAPMAQALPDGPIFEEKTLSPWAKAPRMEVLSPWLGAPELEPGAGMRSPVPLWEQAPPPRRAESEAAPALPEAGAGEASEASRSEAAAAPAVERRPEPLTFEVEQTTTPMGSSSFPDLISPAKPLPAFPEIAPLAAAHEASQAPAEPRPAPLVRKVESPQIFQFKPAPPLPAAPPLPVAKAPAPAKPGVLPAQAPKRPSVSSPASKGAPRPAPKAAQSPAQKKAAQKLIAYVASLAGLAFSMAVAIHLLQLEPSKPAKQAASRELRSEAAAPGRPTAGANAPMAGLPFSNEAGPGQTQNGLPMPAATAPLAPAAASPEPFAAASSGEAAPAQTPAPLSEGAPAPAQPAGLPPMAEALHFAKTYDLGGGRGSLARWFGKSFLASGAEGMTEDWRANEIADGDYLVEYKVLLMKPDGTAHKVKNYIFEVDLKNKTLSGFNGAARSLLIEGLMPQKNEDAGRP